MVNAEIINSLRLPLNNLPYNHEQAIMESIMLAAMIVLAIGAIRLNSYFRSRRSKRQ